MKTTIHKMFFSLLLGIYALSLVSCFQEPPIPYGVWRSEDPNLTLYITVRSVETGDFLGEYVCGTQLINVEIIIDMSKGSVMLIYDPAILDMLEGTVFYGRIAVPGEKLVYTLTPEYHKETGYEKIKFEKIADYDPDAPSSVVIDKPKKARWAEKL